MDTPDYGPIPKIEGSKYALLKVSQRRWRVIVVWVDISKRHLTDPNKPDRSGELGPHFAAKILTIPLDHQKANWAMYLAGLKNWDHFPDEWIERQTDDNGELESPEDAWYRLRIAGCL